jgi:nitroimidazol reductase NimA-like FMN-containing flavoprotein (pyridoxamine 5'-phosphate oxidase superfamily)
MFGTLHPDEIEDLLFTRRVGHLACVVDDRPYIVPISFAYDGRAIYAHTTPGRKVDAMRSRPAVAFEIEDLGDPRRWRSVIVEGRYEELTDDDERRQAERLLADVAAGMSPAPSGIVFRVRPVRKTGRWLQFTTESQVVFPSRP